MSLADSLSETSDVLTWAGLSPSEKRCAVLAQLAEGRNVSEAADMLTIIYGPVGVHQVRTIMYDNRLQHRAEVVLARRVRKEAERRAVLGRARTLKPAALPRADTLPVIPLPLLGGHPSRITIFDLKPFHCRMPLWGHQDDLPPEAKFYCGALRVPGSSYCAACAERLKPTEAEVAGARQRRTAFAARSEPRERRRRFS